jgi:arylsulfatase A-like enzyme
MLSVPTSATPWAAGLHGGVRVPRVTGNVSSALAPVVRALPDRPQGTEGVEDMSRQTGFVPQATGSLKTAALATIGGLIFAVTLAKGAGAQDVLPLPPAPFKGQIGLSAKDSKPDFPQPVQAPKGAPNVVLVLLDDVGFGASSTFGGPVQTPTLDRLAQSGLRYTQFHTTALCSPTRAALLTGRNHHSVHTGVIMEQATGFPGYDSVMRPDTATVAEVLRQQGWNTAWFGKNHNVPDWQSSQAGPFDLWPTRLGFDRFYGFVGAETSQWRPAVFDGIQPVEPYLGNPEYNFDYDIADQAIRWIRNQKAVAPDRPFFLYYAPGATHSPHHPRKEWVAKYQGRFDEGWDRVREETLARQKQLGIVPADTQLTPRHEGIPAWDSLDAERRQLFAYMMEVYAGYLEQTDHNVGRVLGAIDKLGQLDNTLVVYIVGDNGASAEGLVQGELNELAGINGVAEDYREVLARKDDLGTWKTHNHYPIGWAHAMDTPFQWTKQIASHYGGTRNGMVISWPGHIKNGGGIRPQWHHTIDVVPTILEAAGLNQPAIVNGVAQRPIEGVSMAYTFDQPAAPSARRTQYFEMMGNRAIYHDDWVACTTPMRPPWQQAEYTGDVITGYGWELYHVAEDFSQAVNLAKQHPDKLQELQLLFYAEAAKYNVLPLDHSTLARVDVAVRPSLTRGRTEFTYSAGTTRIPEGAAPDIKNKSFRITADLVLAKGDENGVVVTQGGLFGGYALLLKAGRPVFHYNLLNVEHFEIAATDALTAGRHRVVLDFQYDDGGIGRGGIATLSADGRPIAQGRVDRTVPVRFSLDETFDVGEDTGTPVSEDYDVPNRFTGEVEKVVIQLGETKLNQADEQALVEMERIARQATH